MKGMKNVSLNIVTQVALTEPSGTYSLHSVVPSEPVKAILPTIWGYETKNETKNERDEHIKT